MFLYYVYKDELDTRLDAELAATVLHIAQYYGAPRLAGLCERLLAREIKNGDAEDEGCPLPQLALACKALVTKPISRAVLTCALYPFWVGNIGKCSRALSTQRHPAGLTTL